MVGFEYTDANSNGQYDVGEAVTGKGSDTVDYSYVDSLIGVNADLSTGRATDMTGGTQVGSDELINIENIIGTKNKDILIGDAFDNILDGGAGEDTFKGGAGDDIFKGGAGDYIDTVDYSHVDEALFIDLNSSGEKEVSLNEGKDTFDSIEGVIGGSENDTLIGTSGANTLIGNDGDDTLYGNGANAGVDYIEGDEHGTYGDLVSFDFTSNNLTVDLSLGIDITQTTGVGKLVITSVENIQGGFGNDTLTGNSDKNTIMGGAGNDTLIGKGSSDVLDGGYDKYTRVSFLILIQAQLIVLQ